MTPENEVYEFENRTYQSPTTSRDEQLEFIENLRAVQQANNEQIRTQTENLGTNIPSQLGGLTGPESYFAQRYQTAPINQTVATLRSAAQATALNQALSNLQSQYQKMAQDALRNYQKAASTPSTTTSTTTDGGALGVDTNEGVASDIEVNENTTTNGPGYTGVDEKGLYFVTVGAKPGVNGPEAGEKWYLRNLTGSEPYTLGSYGPTKKWPDGTELYNGSTYQNNNGMYLYVQNSQYPEGSIFRVGDTPNYSYK